MKLSEFKQAVNLRLTILKANTIFSFRQGVAYVYNNWGGLASTVTFMITYLAFLSIIYSRVESIAGYNYAQMLLFVFVSQLSFYSLWSWTTPNINLLNQDVNSGRLDLILAKPVPALWYVSFQKINLIMVIFEGLPALIPLLFLMSRNSGFSLSGWGIIYAVPTFILGQILIHCFQFILGLTVFWTGQSKSIIGLGHEVAFFGQTIPLEAYPKQIIVLGLTLIPFLGHVALTTSYLLGRTTSPSWLLLVLAATVFFLWSKMKLWQVALRRYTSASS